MHKGYDNHYCHNKSPDRKWDWSVNDVMPGRDFHENFEKESVESWIWAVEDVVDFADVPTEMN